MLAPAFIDSLLYAPCFVCSAIQLLKVHSGIAVMVCSILGMRKRIPERLVGLSLAVKWYSLEGNHARMCIRWLAQGLAPGICSVHVIAS